jgi:hypothetical protein
MRYLRYTALADSAVVHTAAVIVCKQGAERSWNTSQIALRGMQWAHTQQQ